MITCDLLEEFETKDEKSIMNFLSSCNIDFKMSSTVLKKPTEDGVWSNLVPYTIFHTKLEVPDLIVITLKYPDLIIKKL